MSERVINVEPIVVRNRVVYAELVYVSGRGDYRVYRWQGRTYLAKTPVKSAAAPEGDRG